MPANIDNVHMEISTCKTETIIINNPSEKIKDLVNKAREHKMRRRDQIRNTAPLFTLTV